MAQPAEPLRITADLAELPSVTAWAADLLARLPAPRRLGFAVDLCLEEALSNIIRHGGHSGPITLTATADEASLHITIIDPGPAFDPSGVAAPVLPTALDDAAAGGLGVHLMRKFSTGLTYQRRAGANELRLTFARR